MAPETKPERTPRTFEPERGGPVLAADPLLN